MAGLKPKVPSNENIFTPINSAIIAFAIKNEPNTKNKMVRFDSFMYVEFVEWLIKIIKNIDSKLFAYLK